MLRLLAEQTLWVLLDAAMALHTEQIRLVPPEIIKEIAGEQIRSAPLEITKGIAAEQIPWA